MSEGSCGYKSSYSGMYEEFKCMLGLSWREVEAKGESSVERADAIVSDGVTSSLFSRGKVGGPGIDGRQALGSSWINCSMSFSFLSASWESLFLFAILFLENRTCVDCR